MPAGALLELGPHISEEHASRLGKTLRERVVLVEQIGSADRGRQVLAELVLGLDVEQRIGADLDIVRRAVCAA